MADPDLVWTSHGHPPTAVAALAAVALQLPRNPDGSHLLVVPGVGRLIGAAFRYEAYALISDSTAPAVHEAVRRRSAGGSVPRFRDIPGRIEQRCMTAVDLDGGRYMASSARLDESKPDAAEPDVADPGRDKLTGNVVDATNRFLNAIKPVPKVHTPYPPQVGDLVHLWDAIEQRGGMHEVLARQWLHSSYGLVNWPLLEKQPTVGPLLELIVEPAEGVFRDQAPRPDDEEENRK
ncbi:hypothetical protein [Streptomyces sp. NPDC001307]|uniref:hypothetical protein n=1 Tax=Streptomyces sp. NPDC001307 TaxID=3364560 RepID=UPI0036785DD3